MRIVIGLVEHIGDVVACEPVARYLKLRYPDCSLSWVVAGAYRELIDSNPYVDETIPVDCLTDWIKISKHGKYDKIVDLHVNYRVCAHCRIPLIKEHGNPYINAYEWLDHGALLEAFTVGAGLPKLSAAPRLYLGEAQTQAVDALGLPERYCVIHRESNNLEKDWTGEKWRALAEWITGELKLPIVEIGASKAGGANSPLAGLATDLLNKTSILETGEVIRRAQFFIGVDSGPSHLANAVGAPGIVLLGRMGAFRQYTPYTGLYGSEAPEVKLVRNLNGPARQLPLADVRDAARYVAELLAERKLSTTPAKNPGADMGHSQTLATAELQAVNQDDRDALLASGLFDEGWYVIHHPEVEGSHHSPIDHFLLIGAGRGNMPGPGFDSAAYLKHNPDVAASGMNPLLHYIRFGKSEGRLPGRPVHSDAEVKSAIRHTGAAAADAPLRLSAALEEESFHITAPPAPSSEMPRTFAFYLPQFHPIAENDWAHGKGFTEWNNVIKAKPLFKGHYQPRVPGELGYYDLRAFDVMRDQVELALEHGITGFCFYYYYFHGKKLLYKPIENYVNSDLKAPFFFLWANENWSKRWDGGDQEVIIAQQHSKEDDLKFIRDLFPLFEDQRYTKISGKPLLMIYKAHLFPNMLATVETWRDEAARRGFPGLYLVMVDDWTPEPIQPRTLGFDASYEIPSNVIPADVLSDDIESLGLADDFTGRIVDYQKFAQFHMSRPAPEYRRFRTVMLPWDNTPRYGSRAIVHVNTVGEGYKTWLSQALLDTHTHLPPEERIVLLHSWNEWCEGTYLEPDGKFGRGYLEQTREAIDDVRSVLSLQGSPEFARAIQLLQHVQRRKDEGAFRILQGAHAKSAALWRERDALQAKLAALPATISDVTPPQRGTPSTMGSVLDGARRVRRRILSGT
ncbi:glycoside hydrolase family 99-like domain-containing protein [Cupriavidus pinatubonensis]|uniref:glycoside hydrolase family 99-like domain-containing protein n=1 Tax=Cupriavidus pinatubonensis TaxID=248026 RepID=UPI001C7362D2|nr:glycoside hydrolase family 99-like domain-containing protein [Cupriavidus pinatubonensis]QYY32311.1 glycoside hydrolase family 99-like domain-containing protein [Cupriavidus pinatubonensis]